MEKIINKKKQGSIVDVLRDAILSGTITADTELTQVDIAESLGVSRMPVREALIVLEYQGLIRRLPNNHVKVVHIDDEYITSIFRFISEQEIKLLESHDMKEFSFDGEMDFHRKLCRLESCEFIARTLETAVEVYIGYYITQNSDPDRIGQLKDLVVKAVEKNNLAVKTLANIYFASLTGYKIGGTYAWT